MRDEGFNNTQRLCSSKRLHPESEKMEELYNFFTSTEPSTCSLEKLMCYMDELISNDNIVSSINYVIDILMHYSRLNDTPDELQMNRQILKKTVVSLVRRMRAESEALRNFLLAIVSLGKHASQCTTILRTQDGRFQIDGNKRFPHVITFQIWRWPFVRTKNDIVPISLCEHSFHSESRYVCLNPYHYQISNGIYFQMRDILVPTMLGQNRSPLAVAVENKNDSAQHTDREYNVVADNLPFCNETICSYPKIDERPRDVLTVRDNWKSPLISQANMSKLASNAITHPPKLSKDAQSMPQNHLKNFTCGIKSGGNSSEILAETMARFASTMGLTKLNHRSTPSDLIPVQVIHNNKTRGFFTIERNKELEPGSMIIVQNGQDFVLKNNSHLQQQPMADYYMFHSDENNHSLEHNFENNVNLSAPENHEARKSWCTIGYHEFKKKIGPLLSIPKFTRRAIIDGYATMSTLKDNCFCFSIGQLNNIERTDYVRKCITNIGKGVVISYQANKKDISLKCLSNSSVFVSSYYLDIQSNSNVGTVIHKIMTNVTVNIFNWELFKKETIESYEGLKLLAMGSVNVTKKSIFDQFTWLYENTKRRCIITVSFVKGWGYHYPRKSAYDTPCWVELFIDEAIDFLDKISRNFWCMFQQYYSFGHPITFSRTEFADLE